MAPKRRAGPSATFQLAPAMWVPSVSLVMSGAYEAGPEMHCAKPLGVSSKSIRRLQTNTTRAHLRSRLLVGSDPLCLVNVHSKEASRSGRVAGTNQIRATVVGIDS